MTPSQLPAGKFPPAWSAILTAALALTLQLGAAPANLPDGLSKNDWQNIRAAYEAGRHAMQPVPGIEGQWLASNPGQQWTTTFDQRGFTARPQEGGWEWGMELRSYGFGEHQTAVHGQPEVKAEGQRLSYQWNSSVQEWWINDQRGLEHGFTLTERPWTPGASPETEAPTVGAPEDFLTFTLSVRGGLAPRITSDARGIHFQNHEGATRLTYTGLKVWDADGTVLPAHFASGADDGTVRLLVDERGARYPVTIDPVAQQAYLKAAQVSAGDQFGTSVAISGETVVVGAPFEDGSSPGVNGVVNEGSTESGAAYVFVRAGTSWSQQAYLKPGQVTSIAAFGWSVAISDNTIIVGSQMENSSSTGVNGQANTTANGAGAAFVFVRNGAAWTQQAYLKANQVNADDRFGWSVALSGNTAVVGAINEDGGSSGVNGPSNESATDAGAAYVFLRTGTTWNQQAYLKAGQVTAGDAFGTSVAISGDTVVVGADREDGSSPGVNAAVNESALNAGAAWVFVRNGTAWSQQAYLKASQVTPDDRFGGSVSVSGNTVVVGASGEDSSSSGINSTANEGSSASGAAYIFFRNGTTWSQQAYLKSASVTTGARFGHAVAVAGDIVVIGADLDASNTGGTHGPLNALANSAGAAYIFVRYQGFWSQQAYLKAGQITALDRFGTSVAISGETAVIGAPFEDSSTSGTSSIPNELAESAGAANIFTGLAAAPQFYGVWAGGNIPPGGNTAFSADWNNDGIINGTDYIFGSARFEIRGPNRFPAPPTQIPPDVNITLQRSTTMAAGSWSQIAYWSYGLTPILSSGVSLVGDEVRDSFTGPRAYYRYRVQQQ